MHLHPRNTAHERAAQSAVGLHPATSDPARGAAVAKKISTGMVFINHPTKVEADLLFGGIRRSGYGRELLGLGLKEFVNYKLIDVVDIDAHF